MKIKGLTQAIVDAMVDDLKAQEVEVDNLGDLESVVFMGESPTVNLVMLAEAVKIKIGEKIREAE